MGNITSWTYNSQGQALTKTDPDPDGVGPLPAAVTTFTYDLAGRRTSVTDASGNTTSYGYDHTGRLVESIDPRGNSSYYQYDVAGQVTRVVDRNSRKRDLSYNDLGLVTEEVWVDGFGNAVKTIVHGYDDAGRETSISDGVTGYNYQYDLADRVTYTDNAGSVDMPQVQFYSYYDFEGNRTWLVDNLGGGISYAWNNQRLQSMALFTENYKSAEVGFGYDSVGRLASLMRTTNSNYYTTINTSYTLDLLDRVTSITHSKGMGEDASTLSQFTYGYDANGLVTNYTGPEGSLSFALDANGQLLSVTGLRTDNYSFDANGNRTSNSTAAGNLLLNDGKYSYTYDLEGNQKTKTRISDGQVTEFFWDHRNQLTKAMVKDANGVLLKELRFTYDVEGRRVGSWVDADGAGPEEPDQVWTVFDGVNPYMDFDGDGLLKTRYLYGPGIDELFARIGTGEDPQWYLVDRLGSVRQIVDASGAVLDEISYDSFGGILSESNPSQGDRFKFTGREYSPELGIYYYRARWYDPSSGRFISQDPIGFQAGDPNLYRYVGNAPGDGVDRLGLSEIPQKNWPNWANSLIGKDVGRGVPTRILSITNDMNHPGIGHFDVWFEDELGRKIKQRFHRGGIPFSEPENEFISNPDLYKRNRRDPRRGATNCHSLATLGITTIIIGSTTYYYDKYLEAGERSAENTVTFIMVANMIRMDMIEDNLPTSGSFLFDFRGERYKGWVEKDRNSDAKMLVVVKITKNGIEMIIKNGDIPIQGIK